MSSMLPDPSNADFKKIICRRVPIKLHQFARVLNELMETSLDPIRIKGMESQLRRTKETCEEYGVESTATLLTQIQKQLSMDVETLSSQRPLIKRLINRLESHAERLKLGQINSGTTQAVKSVQKEADIPVEDLNFDSLDASLDLSSPTTSDRTAKPEIPNNELDIHEFDTELTLDDLSQDHEISADDLSFDANVAAETPAQDFTETPQEDKRASTPAEVDSTPTSAPVAEEVQLESVPAGQARDFEFRESVSTQKATSHRSLLDSSSELTIYWCISNNNAHNRVKEQMIDFGYHVEESEIAVAISTAAGDSQKVVIARLEDFPEDISGPINETSYLILFSEHDTLENRLKGIRLGSTLFYADPIDTIKLMEFLDTLERANDSSPFRIAVMEDSKAQAKFNDKVLSSAGFETCIVIEPMELLNSLSNFEPEVIFMDMQMPGCNGIELTQVLRQIERFSTVPIVFLSAEENHEKQREAMTSGGTAFIAKPVKKDQLLFMAELYARRTRNLQPHLARDFQTGLNSASLLKEQLTIEAERAMRQNDTMYLALLEIDDLPTLNEQHGYAFGDRAVQQLSRLLRQRVRKTDCVGFFDSHRIGVILNHCSDQDAESVMGYLAHTFSSTPVAFEGQSIHVNLSVGLSKLGKDSDIQRLVKRSEAALAEAQKQAHIHLIWAHEPKR